MEATFAPVYRLSRPLDWSRSAERSASAMLPLAEPNPPDLEQWYREEVLVHERALRAYLRRVFPIVTDQDNVVQETFVRVLETRRNSEIANVRGYLFATARNQALALMRRREIVAI